MAEKHTKRILVHIPSNLLKEFDKEITGIYASRNEAIRTGMTLVMNAEKKRNTQTSMMP